MSSIDSTSARSLDNQVAPSSTSSVAATTASSSNNNWGKALLVGAGVLVGAVAVAAIGIGVLFKHLRVWRS